MKKLFLKSFALVAMLLCGLTASAVDWSTIAWAGDGAQGGALANKYKVYTPEGVSLVNIQNSGAWATEIGFYITFPDAAFGEFRIDGEKTNYGVQGAGVSLYISNFTAQETEVQVMNAENSAVRWTLYVYYADGTASGSGEEKETIKPTMTSASLAEVSHNAAVINVAGTDKETEDGEDVVVTRFKVVYGETSKTYTATDGKIKIEGLELNKTYTFTIYAVDAAGNVSEEGLTVEATTVLDWSKVAYVGSSAGTEYTNQYKVVVVSGKVTVDVIQNPAQTTEPGIYCILPGAVSSLPIAGKTEGAGAWLYLSAFVTPETKVVIPYAGGSATILVYNEKGSWDNINVALAENGAKAYASSGTAANAIDGNNGTRWESAQSDPQWFVVNLGQQREFNTVQLLWEGAYGKSFTIDYSTDSTTWTNFATIEDQTLSGFPYLQTLTVDNPVTAQYVRFEGTARGTGYGYSFWEFQVLKASEDVLTTLELKAAAAIAKVNESVALTVTGKNQNGVVMSEYGKVEYTVSPADAGAVVDGKYVPAKQGPATIVAAVGEIKSEEVSVFGYEGDNVALSTNIDTDNKVIAQSDKGSGGADAFYAVDGNEGSVWQGSATNGTDGDEASRTYDSWFVLDLGAFYDINLITIKFEGACSDAYHVDASVNNTDWVVMHNFAQTMGTNGHTDYIYGENLTNNTSVRFVRFWSTKASTGWGMKIFEMKVFATAGTAPADDEKPVMVKAELVSNNHNSAVIAVEATDNMGVASYKVVDEANSFIANFTTTNGNITVTGLTQNTTYNLAVSAVDLAGNESAEAKTVQVKTLEYYPTPTTAAPVPVHEAANVKSIYSDTYTPAWKGLNSYNETWWSNPSLDEKDIDGNKFLRYYGNMAGMIGWQFTPIDATGMTHLHLDIWPSVTGTITMGPTYGGDGLTTHVEKVELEVVQEKWNSFDIDLKEHTSLNLTSIFQNQFTGYSAQSEFSVDNVYFWKNGTTTLLDAQEVFPKVTKTIENGQLVIIRDGVKYNVVGSVIEK